jgi:ornithine carbamoyltransferase
MPLRGKVLGMLFQKPSLRTRVSFDRAMLDLGGHALYLSPTEVGLGERESVKDVARVLSRYVDIIMARVFRHADVAELAGAATVPVINGLSDLYHPCQALADLLTVRERFDSLVGRRVVYVGDGNNVAHSLLLGGAHMGMHVTVIHPPGYEPRRSVLDEAARLADASGGSVTTATDPTAAEGAEVLYTDVWASMGDESEAQQRSTAFAPYQLNGRLLDRAADSAIVMHCLPAHRGQEITDEVIDGPHSVVWDQAENRMHTQKALLLWLLGLA